MPLIRIVPAAVRAAGAGAVQAADAYQTQAGELRALPLPPMPAAMAAKYETLLDEIAARLVGAGTQLGPAGIELQLRAAAAETTDAAGNLRTGSAGATLARSIETTIVLPGGTTGTAQISTNEAGDFGTATVPTAGLKLTLDQLTRPTTATSPTTPNATPKPAAEATERPTTGRDVSSGSTVDGRPAAAVHQAVASDGGGGGSASGGASAPSAAQSTILGGDTPDASAAADGQHRAEAPSDEPPKVPADDASRQDWACWMAKSAVQAGVPPSLPIMAALVQSDLNNAGTTPGFFGYDPATTKAPSGHGVAGGIQPADWWQSNPQAQLDLFLKRAMRTSTDPDNAGLTDPDALGQWAAASTPGADSAVMSGASINADELVDGCQNLYASADAAGGGAAAGAGGGALDVAKSQLGVHEVGNNGGQQVDGYLASAGVGSGNPWCASFVHWSLAQSGTEMPGQGWAAVATWVDAAQNGDYGLSIVDAAHAQPGDIVAYDWGGDSNFASDGHIGFLESQVSGGQFTAVEGNAQDAVTRMERNMNVGNVVFIRPGG